MNAPATQWRAARSLAERECETCAHARIETIVAAEHRMCGEENVLRAFGRTRVSAGIARDEACFGKRWTARGERA
jgi:hypothetical protein